MRKDERNRNKSMSIKFVYFGGGIERLKDVTGLNTPLTKISFFIGL